MAKFEKPIKIKNVYIVSSGDYSDYGIRAVFAGVNEQEAKAEAEAYCKLRNGEGGECGGECIVDEWEVNQANYTVGVKEIPVWFATHCTRWPQPIQVSKDIVLDNEFEIFPQYRNSPTPVEVLTLKEQGGAFDSFVFKVYSDESEDYAKKKLYDYKAKMKALWEGV